MYQSLFQRIERIHAMPLPNSIHSRTFFDLRPGHRFLSKKTLLTLLLEGVAGDIFGKFLFRSKSVADLLFAIVMVVRKLHQEVCADELIPMRKDQRRKGLASCTQQTQGNFVTHIDGSSTLGVILGDFFRFYFVQDVRDGL